MHKRSNDNIISLNFYLRLLCTAHCNYSAKFECRVESVFRPIKWQETLSKPQALAKQIYI